MKFGQALSVFEAALPEELAAPYRAALTKLQDAAPPMPAASRAQGAGRPVSGPTGATASSPSTTRRPRRPRSARCTGRSGSDGRDGRGQDPVPGRGPGAAVRPQPAGPARPGCSRSCSARARRQAAARRAQGPGGRGARLRPRGAVPAARSPRPTTATPTSWSRRWSPHARRVLVTRVDRRHAAVRRSSREGTAEQRDRAGLLLPAVPVLRPRPGRAAARRPAPGQLPAAGRRPARRPRLRRGQPAARRAARADRPAGPAGPARRRRRRCSTGCGTRASSSRRRQRRRRRGARLPAARSRAAAGADEFHFTRAWLRQQAARLADPRSPAASSVASSTCRRPTC